MIRSTRGRLLVLLVASLIAFALFVLLPWPPALLGLAGLNLIAAIGFMIHRKRLGAKLAGVTTGLIVAGLFLTDWGLSSQKPVVRIAWPLLLAACASELAMIVWWLRGNHEIRDVNDR